MGRFIDSVLLHVKAGRGGSGSIAYESRMGGKRVPAGGHGGRGGDVVIRADRHVRDLGRLSSFHVVGNDGESGQSNGGTGKQGASRIITVPPGTTVFKRRLMMDASARTPEEEEEEDQEPKPILKPHEVKRHVIADLQSDGDSHVVAKGGAPGKGNVLLRRISNHFYDFGSAHKGVAGREGQEASLELRLKLIADVSLVGFPNAGKSSLLSALSLAKPKVAPYPFTTLHPHLGFVEFTDGERVSVADLPGLIEGAHENRGMGHAFLQHVERTKAVVFVVDTAPEAEGSRGRMWGNLTPRDELLALRRELELYLPGLSSKPSLVVANKRDAWISQGAGDEVVKELRAVAPPSAEKRVFSLSALTGEGMEDFVVAMRQLVESVNRAGGEWGGGGGAEDDGEEEVVGTHEPLSRVPRGTRNRLEILRKRRRLEALGVET